MKNVAALIGAMILAAGSAQAANTGNTDYDLPSAPVVAEKTIQVEAGQILSPSELTRTGLDAETQVTVSDFTAPGERSTYIR